MKTILITRFAIELDSSFTFFESKEGIDWFNQRLSLFKKTCLPSIINQELMPNLWLIFIMKNDYISSELSNVIKGIDFIKIVEIEQSKPFNEIVSDYLLKMNLSKSITTRLDCDDALFPEYFKVLQSVSNDKSFDCLFEPTKGLSLKIENNTITRAAYIKKLLPPFLSFINISGQSRHVFSFNHDEWPADFNKETLDNIPLWIQISHNKNISNQFGWGWMVKSVLEVNPRKIQKLFANLDVVKVSHFNRLKSNLSNLVKQLLFHKSN